MSGSLRLRWRLGILGCLALASTPLLARAAVEVGVEIDREEVVIGEQVVLTISVNGDVRDVREPELGTVEGLEIYGGGQSRRYNFVNGRVSAVHSFTFYLRPLHAGSYRLDSMRVVVEGRSIEVRPVEFRALPANARTKTEDPSSAPPAQSGDADVFITLTVDQDSVVVGQQVILTFGYYRATRASAFDSPEYTPPTTEGFWREDLPPNRRTSRVIRSRRYQVTEIRYALFPTHAGELTIGPAQLRLTEDVFGSFFRSRRRRGPTVMRTEDLTVHVDPLPPPPPGFSGAVGRNFAFEASVDRQELAVGDALTLTLRLEGDGHLASARDPEIDGGELFRLHDAGGGVDSRPTLAGLRGVRVVQKLLIPARPGAHSIPAVDYIVFDTDAMDYRTLRTSPIPLQIVPAEGGGTATVVAGGRQSEIALLARDILHIRSIDPDLEPVGGPLVRRPVFWALLVGPIFFWVGSGELARRRRALAADPQRLRDRRARRRAQEILDSSRPADEKVDAALRAYVADRSGLSPAGLRRAQLRQVVVDLGADEVEAEEVLAILDECDALRFAPGSGESESLTDRAAALLDRLEAHRA